MLRSASAVSKMYLHEKADWKPSFWCASADERILSRRLHSMGIISWIFPFSLLVWYTRATAASTKGRKRGTNGMRCTMIVLLTEAVPLVLDLLTIADVVRLLEAVCAREHVIPPAQMQAFVQERLGLVRPLPAWETSANASCVVSVLMRSSRTRCKECGTRTHRQCEVCVACAADVRSYRSQVTFRALLEMNVAREWRLSANSIRRKLSGLRVVALGRTGARLYWRREAVQVLFGGP